MNFVDAVHYLIRYAIQAALDWPENTVIPANSVHPVGTQINEYATVQLIEADDDMLPVRQYSTVPPTAPATAPTNQAKQELSHQHTFKASINFYNNTAADTSGQAKYGNQAYSDALALHSLLQLETSTELLTWMGLAYAGHSQVRDLTALVDGNFQNRAQVDIMFAVVDSESAVLGTFGQFQIGMQFQPASGGLVVPLNTEEVST